MRPLFFERDVELGKNVIIHNHKIKMLKEFCKKNRLNIVGVTKKIKIFKNFYFVVMEECGGRVVGDVFLVREN